MDTAPDVFDLDVHLLIFPVSISRRRPSSLPCPVHVSLCVLERYISYLRCLPQSSNQRYFSSHKSFIFM
uniref:Uncharacterized protein n=1 Tax=Arundo donax TaxID=35708 RepID=A0A0A9DGF5_ARUDO